MSVLWTMCAFGIHNVNLCSYDKVISLFSNLINLLRNMSNEDNGHVHCIIYYANASLVKISKYRIYIKRRCGMIANETAVHKRPTSHRH